MQKLIINGRLPGRNEAENAARTHWAVGAKLKKEATELVQWEAIRQHIKPYAGVTIVEVTFYEKDSRRDADNIISGLKYILDGLVNAKIIVNDTRGYVMLKINPIKVDKKAPRVEVQIYGQSNTTA